MGTEAMLKATTREDFSKFLSAAISQIQKVQTVQCLHMSEKE